MPPFELYRRANVSLDSNPPCSRGQSHTPENDFFELVCENGQILMQGYSNPPKGTSACKSLPSQCLPSHSPRVSDMRFRNIRDARFGKLEEYNSVIDEIPMPVPSSELGLNQDEDVLPWLNCAIENPLQHEYNSDLLAELSGVTAYELNNRENSSVVDKNICYNHAYQSHKNSVHGGASSEQGNVSKVSYGEGAGAAMLDTNSNRLYQPSSEPQTSMTSLRSREFNIHSKTNNGCRSLYSDDMTPVPSTSSSSDFKMLNQDSVLLNSSSTMMNFSHFARPAALVRTNLHSIGAMCGLPARTDSVANEERKFTPSFSNARKSTPTDSSNGCAKQSTEQGKQGMLPSNVDRTPLHSKSFQDHTAAAKPSEPVCKADAPKDEETSSQIPIEDTAIGLTDGEKSMEPVVVSSVCSGYSVEKASNELIPKKRRKTLDTDESEWHSEDIEEESVGVKRAALAQGGAGSKRSRAAEVHNLSERRRRDRINEKMRVLQELIPNCNKVDKASMLDEAIEYLKTLQLQVQMMSMGAGLCMTPMMLPTAMQHLHGPHMPSFLPMGVGVQVGFGMGYGMGMPDINGTSSYPMMQIPTVQGSQFPTPPKSGQIGLYGMAGSTLQMFGLPGQGHFLFQ